MLVKQINPPLQSTNGFNTDSTESAAGVDVNIVKEANPNGVWILDSIQCSYKGGTPEGRLVVKDGSKVVFDLDITINTLFLDLYIATSPGNNLEIMLYSGGESIVGKLNIQTHLEANF